MAAVAVLVALPAPSEADAQTADEPLRLGAILGAPEWLELGVVHRTRVGYLENQFRASDTAEAPDPFAVSLRTLVAAGVEAGPGFVRLEVQDSRVVASDNGGGDATILNTTIVNPLEVLEALVGVRFADAVVAGDALEVRAGRLTLDLGKRRLVARNRFRNTINGFTGVDATWTSAGGHRLRAFAAMPVRRRPSDPDGLESDRAELDKENTDAALWTLYYGAPAVGPEIASEVYAVGFHERDGERESRDRQLATAVVRVFREPATERLDFEVEGMVQVGRSSLSTAPDARRLDHRAHFVHAEVGYSIEAPWRPRVLAQYDLASGDGDPDDGTNGRFDTLFGARRFDFGPTGIFGAFARSNISTPGLRVAVRPMATVGAFVAYRGFWLASATDAWTTASGVVDPTGAAGSFVGQQIEGRVRWDLVPGNLRLEVGAAALARGRFARKAPGGRNANAGFFYTQLTLAI